MLDVLERQELGAPAPHSRAARHRGAAAVGLGVRRAPAAAPRPRPAGAHAPHPRRDEPGDRGRVLRPGRGAAPLRRLPARDLPARLARRWRELARTARHAVVFADFAAPAPLEPGEPVEVALPRDAQLNREWLVICDSPDLPAFLTAVERPGQDAASADRRFEALWSVDPLVVRDASRVAAALADRYRPGLAAGRAVLPDEDPAGRVARPAPGVGALRPDGRLPRRGPLTVGPAT